MTTALHARVDRLADFLHGRRVVVLTGAGCSTESGIPDYRGPETRRRARSPMQYREFVRDPASRARYWARSTVGWSRVEEARPNAAHVALARLEAHGSVQGVITQNVDRLHDRAGSERVVELHGTLHRVRCMGCEATSSRAAMQRRLVSLNPDIRAARAAFAPDGDADVAERHLRAFRVPECRWCGGVLKPDVVFFGESVPAERVQSAWDLYADGDVLLVVGSSLAVFSGFRFVLRADQEGRPVAILNLGPTRGDDRAALRIEGRAGELLPALAERLCA